MSGLDRPALHQTTSQAINLRLKNPYRATSPANSKEPLARVASEQNQPRATPQSNQNELLPSSSCSSIRCIGSASGRVQVECTFPAHLSAPDGTRKQVYGKLRTTPKPLHAVNQLRSGSRTVSALSTELPFHFHRSRNSSTTSSAFEHVGASLTSSQHSTFTTTSSPSPSLRDSSPNLSTASPANTRTTTLMSLPSTYRSTSPSLSGARPNTTTASNHSGFKASQTPNPPPTQFHQNKLFVRSAGSLYPTITTSPGTPNIAPRRGSSGTPPQMVSHNSSNGKPSGATNFRPGRFERVGRFSVGALGRQQSNHCVPTAQRTTTYGGVSATDNNNNNSSSNNNNNNKIQMSPWGHRRSADGYAGRRQLSHSSSGNVPPLPRF